MAIEARFEFSQMGQTLIADGNLPIADEVGWRVN